MKNKRDIKSGIKLKALRFQTVGETTGEAQLVKTHLMRRHSAQRVDFILNDRRKDKQCIVHTGMGMEASENL